MKKFELIKTLVVLVVIAGAFTLVSCGGSKKTPGSARVKVDRPCRMFSDNNFFRGTGTAESPKEDMAVRIARTSALTELGRGIETTVKSVGDNYASQYTTGDAMEVKGKYEEMSRQVSSQTLNNVATACEEVFWDDTKKIYIAYIALQVGKDEVFNNVASRVSKDDKLAVDYEKAKFEKIFNEEMDKLAQEQSSR
jgi:hypothetical protein